MKRYKINMGCRVNTHASKSGIKWEYRGKTDNLQEVIEDFDKFIDLYRISYAGLRITDTVTGQVVYEKTIQ